MNLILFDPDESLRPLPRADRRALHLLDTLQRQPGDTFDAGLVNGPRGRGTLLRVTATALELAFVWETSAPPPEPITLLVGLPRPQTARDILRDATTLGVGSLRFVRAAKTDPNYARSTLWSSGEWRRHLITGAEQAFSTRLPEVAWDEPLADVLASLPSDATRLALDNYEATCALSDATPPIGRPLVLAIGGERGWATEDRAALRQHHFILAHVGSRVLRTETACVAALSLARAALKLP